MNGAGIYNKIIENTKIISQSYGGTLGADGYAEGYSKANAYVLIPAFQAAIEGKSPTRNDPTKSKFPLPNWKLVYSGLKNIPFINSKFSKFDVLHAYTSTYTATGIQRSVDYYNFQTNSISDPSLSG